ncbi:Protein transport protein sft2 [Umbelopsis nana]
MSNSAESNFRNSLRGFNSNSRAAGIQLPTNTNSGGNPVSRTWASFTSGAADAFDNARRTVQGYVPVGAQEEVDEPWFQMSRWERMTACALCVVLGIACFCMAFFLFLPVLVLFPGKFAATFTLGSILMLVSVALLRGPWAHAKHMMSLERLPFTAAYLGTMALTLYFSIGARNYVLTIICAVLQIVALLWYFGSYVPGGVSTLRFGSRMVGRQAATLLPF